MKKNEVVTGGIYTAKVSGRVTRVKIIRPHYAKGWVALNLATGREVQVKTAARLRERVGHNA